MKKINEWKTEVFTPELVKNKVYGIILFLFGLLTVFLMKDGTFCILSTMTSLCLFFSKENWIYEADGEDDED